MLVTSGLQHRLVSCISFISQSIGNWRKKIGSESLEVEFRNSSADERDQKDTHVTVKLSYFCINNLQCNNNSIRITRQVMVWWNHEPKKGGFEGKMEKRLEKIGEKRNMTVKRTQLGKLLVSHIPETINVTLQTQGRILVIETFT